MAPDGGRSGKSGEPGHPSPPLCDIDRQVGFEKGCCKQHMGGPPLKNPLLPLSSAPLRSCHAWVEMPQGEQAMGAAMGRLQPRQLRPTWCLLGHLPRLAARSRDRSPNALPQTRVPVCNSAARGVACRRQGYAQEEAMRLMRSAGVSAFLAISRGGCCCGGATTADQRRDGGGCHPTLLVPPSRAPT
jgi:hypothetical protein